MMLLDTHIFLNLMAGLPMPLLDEYESGRIAVSPVSAAEAACLQRLGRITLSQPADAWFDEAVRRAGAQVLPLTAGVMARAMLFEGDHRDPADRILVQTLLNSPAAELHTRDMCILAYASANGLRVRDCRS